MKGLDFLGLSANKLNTFHKNSLPDNIVDGLKTLDLASNPYICICDLIWFIKWLNNTKSVILQYPQAYAIPHHIVQASVTVEVFQTFGLWFRNLMAHCYRIGQVYEAKDRNEICCQEETCFID
jgi:hypothetical protein